MRRFCGLLLLTIVAAGGHVGCKERRLVVPQGATASVTPPAAGELDAGGPMPNSTASGKLPAPTGHAGHRDSHSVRCGDAECQWPAEICCSTIDKDPVRFACAPVPDVSSINTSRSPEIRPAIWSAI